MFVSPWQCNLKGQSLFCGHLVTTPIEYSESSRVAFYRKPVVPKFGSNFENSLILALAQNMRVHVHASKFS